MRILGFSGVAGAEPFKRANWAGRDEREYRISQGYDSAAALVVDGVIVAAVAEERLCRRKHTGEFPTRAIHYCLAEGGLRLEDLDELVHGFDYAPVKPLLQMDPMGAALFREVYSRDAVLGLVAEHLPGFPGNRLFHVGHHMAHAASAYYTSGWNKCLVVVCDGMGEAHSMSVYHACNGRLDLIDQVSALDSIGILYSLVTLHLGFDFNSDEYKVMGLAPYGDSERYRSFFDEAVIVRDGKVRIPLLRLNRSNDERHLYLASRAYLATHLPPERLPGEELTIEHCDVAAALQACLDRFMTQICGHYGRTLGQRRLALAGGVALNCTANGKLLRSGDFDEVYVQPAAGDDGSALGAALWRAAFHDEAHNQRMATPFIGPRHSSDSVERAIRNFGDRIEITRFPSLETACDDAARLIAAGRVLGWYRGRMEFGPRALGHRSILADPAHPEMRERINAMVKMREAFRPFAPSVTLEEVDRWFVVPPGTALPYMIMIVEVRPEHRASLPAVTHVDGTARVQSVSAADDPDFHTLLKAIGRHTGRELVLNTSFNIKGQPIVDTPSDAVETFLSTGIQHLYLENIRLDRRS